MPSVPSLTSTEATARLTPFLHARAPDLCPLRLRRDFYRSPGERPPFLRWRLRTPLVQAITDAHPEAAPARCPTVGDLPPPGFLLPEESALWRRMTSAYASLFAAEPLRADPSWAERPAASLDQLADDPVEIGGGIDVVGRDRGGTPELRQLELWGRPLPAHPLQSSSIVLAVLRLSAWAGDRLRVRLAGLLDSSLTSAALDLADVVPRLRAELEARLTLVERRVNRPVARLGSECATCAHVCTCPEVRRS